MRQLSSVAKRAIFAQETEQVFLPLLTIEHPSLTTPIRCVNNTEPIVSNGRTFAAFPFTLTLPDDRDETPTKMHLSIDNVDQTIIQAVRTMTSAASIILEVVLAASPNVIEVRFEGLELKQVNYDAMVIEGDIEAEAVLSEPFPHDAFIPSLFPGLF